MDNLPVYIALVFILTVIATLYFLYRASAKSKMLIIILCAWLVIQGFLGIEQFYTNTIVTPPRFIFLILPPLIGIILLLTTSKGKIFIDRWNLQWLTWLHIVRIPVELVLLWLFMYKKVPQLMTFEGRNFDILSGITAPIIAWLVWKNTGSYRKILMVWNCICLVLLMNIVVNAVLSAPFPFQQFAFDQPNIAVLYFPFVWLPGFVVPAVLISHLVVIRALLKKQK